MIEWERCLHTRWRCRCGNDLNSSSISILISKRFVVLLLINLLPHFANMRAILILMCYFSSIMRDVGMANRTFPPPHLHFEWNSANGDVNVGQVRLLLQLLGCSHNLWKYGHWKVDPTSKLPHYHNTIRLNAMNNNNENGLNKLIGLIFLQCFSRDGWWGMQVDS